MQMNHAMHPTSGPGVSGGGHPPPHSDGGHGYGGGGPQQHQQSGGGHGGGAAPPQQQQVAQQQAPKELNAAMLCRFGQETVQEIASRAVELFQILKTTQVS